MKKRFARNVVTALLAATLLLSDNTFSTLVHATEETSEEQQVDEAELVKESEQQKATDEKKETRVWLEQGGLCA